MLNTLATAQRLTQAGMPREQAEALTLAINEGLTNTAATKDDLSATEQTLCGEIKTTEQRLDANIDTVEQSLCGEIKATEQRLDAKIEATEQTLRGEIKATEQRLDAKIDATEQTLRGEIKATEQTLRGEIKATEQRLDAKIDKKVNDCKVSLIQWMISLFMAQTAIIVGIMALIVKG